MPQPPDPPDRPEELDPNEGREYVYLARLIAAEARGGPVDLFDPKLFRPRPGDLPDYTRTAVGGRGCMILWHCREAHPERFGAGCEAHCRLTWELGQRWPWCFGHRGGLDLDLPEFQREELALSCHVCPVECECQQRSEQLARDLERREAEGPRQARPVRAAPAAAPRSRSWFATREAARRFAPWTRMVDAVSERVARAVRELALRRYAVRWSAELEAALREGPIEALPLERLEARIPEVVARGVCPPFYPAAMPAIEPGAPAPPDPSWPRLRVEDLAQEIADRGALAPSRDPRRPSVDLGFFYAGNGGTTLLSEFRGAEAFLRTPPRGEGARGAEALVWSREEGAWLLPGERRPAPGAPGAPLDAPPADWDVEANGLLLREVLAYEEDGRRAVEGILVCAAYRDRLLEHADAQPGASAARAREALQAYPRWPSSLHVVLA